jgi:competence protein ComGC
MGENRVSWVEIVLLLAIVLLIVVIATPGLLRKRRAVNEEEAIAALRTLNTVEGIYASRHPATGYTCSLQDLANDLLIDSKLGSGTRAGYRLSSAGCRSTDPKSKVATEYVWFADPVNAETGTRHFCADQTMTVRASERGGNDCLNAGSEP